MTKLPYPVKFLHRFLPQIHRPFTALAVGLMVFSSFVVFGVLSPKPTGAIRQPEASPATMQSSATPIATPPSTTATRCSVVLGIGASGDACVAFVQAVPGLDAVDLTLGEGDDATETDIAFGDYVDFAAVSSGDEMSVQVNDSASPDLHIAEASLNLQPDVAYAVVLEQAYDGDGPVLTAVPIDLAPLGPDESRLMFHHAVTDAAQLSVLGLPAPSDQQIAPGETTSPITVEAGPFSVDVVPGDEPDDVLASLDVQLEASLSYIVIVAGTTGDQTVQVVYAAAPVATAA